MDIALIEGWMYDLSQLFLWPVLASIVALFLYAFYFTLAEVAGVSDPITVAVDADDGRGYAPIPEQIKLLVDKAVRLARLRSLPSSAKRVAILYYNYPPGERSASASLLNVPRSLESIFNALRVAGYQVDELKERQTTWRSTCTCVRNSAPMPWCTWAPTAVRNGCPARNGGFGRSIPVIW